MLNWYIANLFALFNINFYRPDKNDNQIKNNFLCSPNKLNQHDVQTLHEEQNWIESSGCHNIC